MASELIDAADEYIELGLSVIALTGKAPNGKVHPHGLKDALYKDHAGLKDRYAAFTHPDTTGIGLLTGPVWYVVDVDGPEGAEAWRDIAGEEEFVPDRWTAKTGRGIHMWVSDYNQWPTTKLAEKLDFKGIGGYVAAPPSKHPDGGKYVWLAPPSLESPPLEMPQGLRDVLQAREYVKQRASAKRAIQRRAREAFKDGIITSVESFDGIIKKMTNAQPGERNNVLNWAAYVMLDSGADETDMNMLLDAACDTGLDRREALRTMNSAYAAFGSNNE